MSRFQKVLAAVLLISAIGIAGYARSVRNGFVWDDSFQIVRNPYVHPDQPWQELFVSDVWGYTHPGRSGMSNCYRPLQMWCYWLLAAGDLQPAAYHWASLLANVLACWIAFILIYLLFGRFGVALGAASLFAAHPIHSEAVLWISALPDVGCAVFYFLAFCLYLDAWRTPEQPVPAAKRGKSRARGGRPRSRCSVSRLVLSLAALFVSLLWKEMALSFPLVVFAHVLITAGTRWKTRVWEALARSVPFGVVVGVYVTIRISILGYFAKVQHDWVLSPAQYVLTSMELAGKYWLKLLWPMPLNSYYVFNPVRDAWEPRTIVSLVFFAAALVLAFTLARRRPVPAFAVAWVFLTLLPVLNLRGIGANVFTERYLYIPSLGFCALVGWAAAEWIGRMPERVGRVVAVSVTAAAVVSGVAEIWSRTPDWEGDYSLLSAAVKLSPDSAVIHDGLGQVLRDQKRDLDGAVREFRLCYEAAAAQTPPDREEMALALVGLAGVDYERRELNRSLEYVKQALALDPSCGHAHVAEGIDLLALGRLDEAQQTFEKAYTYYPNDEVVADGLGLVAFSREQWSKASEYFSRAVQIDHGYADGYSNLGRAWTEQGRLDEALRAFERALELAPENALFHVNFGVALGRAGRLQEARSEFERALALDPSLEWARQSLQALDRMESSATRH